MGYHDEMTAAKTAYANGTLTVSATDTTITISGKTYECKGIIKEMGARWDRDNKVWTIAIADMRNADVAKLHEMTDGEYGHYDYSTARYSMSATC